MRRATTTTPELALPIASLMALRHALAAEVGADAAAHALRAAGHAAGDALYPLLSPPAGDPDMDGEAPAPLSEAEFWSRLADLLATRGWGHLSHEAVHAGAGALDSADWVEADPENGALRPSCHFTTGLLANLLGHAAGDDVGVLEVECRSRGDLRCRFLFGGADALEAIHAAVAAGTAPEQALAELA